MVQIACTSLQIKRNGTIVPFRPPIGPTQKKARMVTFLLFKGRCAFCGCKGPLEWHHTSYSHENEEFSFSEIPCCRRCHSRQHGFQEYTNDNQLDFWLKKTG